MAKGVSIQSEMNMITISMKPDNHSFEMRSVDRPQSKIFRTSAIMAVALLLVCWSARAAINSVDVQLSTGFSGTPPRSSVKPWMDVLYQDTSPNTVRLTITAPHLTNPELAQYLYLNYNDTKTVTGLTFTPVFSLWQGVATVYSQTLSKNNLQAATGGKYDIQLGFQTAGGLSGQFNGGDKVVFDITTSSGSLSSFDFAFKSVPGAAGSFYAAAFIMQTGNGEKANGYIGASTFTSVSVPEPVSGMTAAGLCLFGLVVTCRRKVEGALAVALR